MIVEVISGNLEYPMYGSVDADLSVKRMLFGKGEEVDFYEQIFPNVTELIRGHNIFLFLHCAQNYPIPFRYKNFGMWDDIQQYCDQKFINPIERKAELRRYCAFYGICEIEKSQLEVAFELLAGGLLIFSKENIVGLESIERHLDVTDKSFDVKIAEAVNSYCQEGGIVATKINGLDGMSINLFYQE